MTEDSDDEYYVAELVDDATEEFEVQLSPEEMEQVAELQSIHRQVDLNDYTPDYVDTDTMPDDLRNKYELTMAELIRRERHMSDEEMEDTANFFGIEVEELQSLGEEEDE